MKLLRKYRSNGAIAALTALLFCSGNANAIQIDVGGFADNGSLTIIFDGVEMGGNPDKLEFLSPDVLTSFSAVYDADNLMNPLLWDQSEVGSLVYDGPTGILESLSAFNLFSFFELSVGDSVLQPGNYVEITNLLTGDVLSSQEFPDPNPPGAVPVPGTLLLLSLGLLLIGLRRI